MARVILLLILLRGVFSAGALPVFEPFVDAAATGGTLYANGAPLYHQTNAVGESWAQWNGGDTTNAVVCTNFGLAYTHFPPGFPAPLPAHAVYLPSCADPSGGVGGQSAALGFSASVSADLSNQRTNAIYASFLLKVANLGNLSAGGNAPIYFAGFATNTGDQSVKLPASAMKLYLQGNLTIPGQSTAYSIGVADNSGSASAAWDGGGHTSNDVLFVVVDYEFGINGSPDVARLWVNPDPGSFSLPFPPAEAGSIAITAATNKIARAADFFLLARGGATLWGGLLVGCLRVGATWSYVTGGPDTTLPVLLISGTRGQVVLNGINNAPGATNILLSSTNLALPLSNWTRVATNLCDSRGHFNFTNRSPAEPERFYRAQALPLNGGSTAPDLWVPASGAWLGAVLTNATAWGDSTVKAILHHESMIGRQLDILREYRKPGWTSLSAQELAYINAGRKVLISFKPNSQWGNAVGVANGGSVTVDAQLTSLAQSVAAIKPRKLMLCVWHEPQNDVGSAGTTEEYVAMWHNVRNIFDANGATNVVWVWNVQGPPAVRSLVPDLWPGNSYVDWVTWDRYQSFSGENFLWDQTEVYNWFVSNSDATHDYLSKPWGWAEWGVGVNNWLPSVADQTNTINTINDALNSNRFPRIRYAAYFDNNAGPNATSAILPGTWGAYSNFANSPYMLQQ